MQTVPSSICSHSYPTTGAFHDRTSPPIGRGGRRALDGSLISKNRPLFASPESDVALNPRPLLAPPGEMKGSLNAFGMFWKRDDVHWSGRPRLLGQQRAKSSHINFADQIGVYLLHDRDRTIYVGRTLETLHTRLKTHTVDRMAGRWDRFSWFGLRRVGSDGLLLDCPPGWRDSMMIETIEAVLIESLEPPLNRKRGDRLSGIEYLQVADPEVERSAKKQLLADIMRTMGLEDI